MNKSIKSEMTTSAIRKKIKERWKDLLLLAILALALLFAAWKVFHKDNSDSESVSLSMTEAEAKVSRLLQEIEGVGDAEVIVCETENGEKSVVVVCEGANNLRVIMNVREAVAAAVGTDENSVKIYLKKE